MSWLLLVPFQRLAGPPWNLHICNQTNLSEKRIRCTTSYDILSSLLRVDLHLLPKRTQDRGRYEEAIAVFEKKHREDPRGVELMEKE